MKQLAEVQQALLRFRDERNWAQFHTLKDLMISLNLEAAELLELSQWKSEQQLTALAEDEQFRERLRDECADVFLYLLLICEKTGIDLLDAAAKKIDKNAEKYPVEQFYGSSEKYSTLKNAVKE